MDSPALRYFCVTARHLNFTRATNELYITQPALSAAIRRLETELGTTLFNRTSRQVSLTPAGHVLMERSVRILRT
jgi:DNA-binding transcriptional LysR family regulator